MKFFTNYLSLPSIIPLLDNENDFLVRRRRLLNKPTITEHQIALRIVQTIEPADKPAVDNPLVKTRLDKESKWINNLIIHYTHEKQLEGYKKDIHQLWNHIFAATAVMQTNLIIGNRNNQSFEEILMHRRPQQCNSR